MGLLGGCNGGSLVPRALSWGRVCTKGLILFVLRRRGGQSLLRGLCWGSVLRGLYWVGLSVLRGVCWGVNSVLAKSLYYRFALGGSVLRG